MCEKIIVSSLPKTWILDLDGTIVKHNGYKIDGHDTLLPGAGELLNNISSEDMVIIVTSRLAEYADITEKFLAEQGIRYEHIIYGVPYGERILINDRKASGLKMAVAVNLERDVLNHITFHVDKGI